MSSVIRNNRFLISRRILQFLILGLFIASNIFGFVFLRGNLSAAKLFDVVYLADPYASIQMLFAGTLISLDILMGSLLILALYALFAGRSFCSWVCPINIVSDSASWLRRKLNIKRGKSQEIKMSRNTRYWILGLSLLLSSVLGVAAFEYISPISMLHRGVIYGMGTAWIVVLMVFLFDLLVLKHGWCGYVCPLGAFYSALTKHSLLRIRHDKDACTDCNDCKIVCPEVQVLDIIGKKDGIIAYGACTNCGRCIDVCHDNALKYSFKKLKL